MAAPQPPRALHEVAVDREIAERAERPANSSARVTTEYQAPAAASGSRTAPRS
jgi:hypothetical protein